MRTHADVIDWCAKHEAARLTKNSISSDTRDNRHLSLQQLTEKRTYCPRLSSEAGSRFSGNNLRTALFPLY